MENFNNNNLESEKSNGLEPEGQSGSISGFDNESTAAPQGYTVTPQGGFYTRSGADIIQDEVISKKDETATPEQNPIKESADYRPTGSYGQSSSQHSTFSPPYTTPKTGSAPLRPKPKKTSHRFGVAAVIIAAVLAAAMASVGTGIVFTTLNDSPPDTVIQQDDNTPPSNINISVDKTADSVAQAVAEKVTRSVVGIRTSTSVVNFFGSSESQSGEGSGVIYSSDGYIITNYHVIESAAKGSSGSKIEVYLESKSSEPYEASVVGYNISSDLAVIKINASGLTPVELGDSSELKVGQYVITIGSPGGLEFMGSVTYGIISGLDRTVSSESKVPLIQTDAAINPGNSGGALLNTKGQLIGINSSKIVAEEYEGMGFSIPVNTVKEKCDSIIAKENDPEPYLGITVSEKYTAEVLKYYGYPVGAVVLSADEGSPAYEAGIRRGDIITEFADTELSDYTMLEDLLFECQPGSTVPIRLYRAGRYYNVSVTIASNNSTK